MQPEVWISTGVLVVAIALFVSDKLRLDVVALMALLVLALTGVLTLEEALAGFSNPVVLMMVGLFVVGAALSDTGVADWLAHRLEALAGQSETRLVTTVMLVTASLSAFMSSTGTVTVLLPVVGTLAQRRGVPASRVLMPLAFAAHLGSMLTLISTAPNLIASEALRRAGRAPFQFFSYFPAGIVILTVGIVFFVAFARRKLPAGDTQRAQRMLSPDDLGREYGLLDCMHTAEVVEGSKLIGMTLAEASLRPNYHVTVVGIQGHRGAKRVLPGTVFEEGDLLRVHGAWDPVSRAADHWGLELLSPESGVAPSLSLAPEESVVELVIPRRSRLAGRSLKESRFRDRHSGTVLAVRRGREEPAMSLSAPEFKDFTLRAGDVLLVKGRRKYLQNLREERRDFVLLSEPDGQTTFVDRGRALFALAVTLGMLVVMAFGWLPSVLVILLAAVLMVLRHCVSAREAYRAVGWESVVLIAGMIPVSFALEKSGAMGLVVGWLEPRLFGLNPWLVLGLLMFTTSIMGLVVSNTATALLVAPAAVRLATALDLAPEPLLMGVAVAASGAFATPIASPVNSLVMAPGGYRFADYVRVGAPLQILVLLTGLAVIPWIFPF